MTDWTPDRIRALYDLAVHGRAGVWVWLEGGPRGGSRAFLPHLDWLVLHARDASGATWTFASPPNSVPTLGGGALVGTYVFDRDNEVLAWRSAHIPDPMRIAD